MRSILMSSSLHALFPLQGGGGWGGGHQMLQMLRNTATTVALHDVALFVDGTDNAFLPIVRH